MSMCAHCGRPKQGYAGIWLMKLIFSVCHTGNTTSGPPDCYRRIMTYDEPVGALIGVDPLPEGIQDIHGK